MEFVVGQRVRAKGEPTVAVITAVFPGRGGARYRVAPGKSWEYRADDLVPVYDDPFELLVTAPTRLYPYDGWLRREAQRLLDAYRNDPTAALSNSRVEPQYHQVGVLLRALEAPRPRLILADEVGLGKTIEAGLILKELRARNVVRRVLILVPASLVTQWVLELQTKFNEVFIYHDAGHLRYLEQKYPGTNPWTHEPNVIASYQFARGDGDRISDADWDLVVFDEAHHARRHWNDGEPRSTQAYTLMEGLRDRVPAMLLLTATPMQLHDFELYSLVELVAPGLFAGYADFVSKRDRIATINRQLPALRGGTDRLAETELRDVLQRWEAPGAVRAADLGTASGREIVAAWLEGQHLLAQVLIRNRRALVGGFTKRLSRTLEVTPTTAELELERDVVDYIRERYGRAAPAQRAALGLVLTTFLKLLASSSRALASALENRAKRLTGAAQSEDVTFNDDPDLNDELRQLTDAASQDAATEAAELRALARRARELEDTKLNALSETLDELFRQHADEKVLIFTQFLGTLEMIRERLAPKFSVQTFHGLMSREEKDAAHRLFKERSQVLISSEAGGEGRNFQFAHILFNYDLPWNPMRIEQRIGRLDRVGQTQNVLIYNFAVLGTLDERILHLLQERIQIFTESVGALEPILGEVESRLREIVLTDAAAARAGVERYEVAIDEQLRRARAREGQFRDLVMDSASFRRDEAARVLGERPMATPADLERFVRAALMRYPSGLIEEQRLGVLRITVPAKLREAAAASLASKLLSEYIGTFDWRVALDDERLEFFAFGHPLVDNLVQLVTSEDFCPLAVLESPDVDWFDSLIVDYEVRYRGVRSREMLFSHMVTPRGVTEAVGTLVPSGPLCEASSLPISRGAMEQVLERSRAAAEAELEQRDETVQGQNRAAYELERRRLERRYDFEARFLTERIDQNEVQINSITNSGDDAARRILPALKGRISLDRDRLAILDFERQAEFTKLDGKRTATSELRIAGIVRLVPEGSLDCANESSPRADH